MTLEIYVTLVRNGKSSKGPTRSEEMSGVLSQLFGGALCACVIISDNSHFVLGLLNILILLDTDWHLGCHSEKCQFLGPKNWYTRLSSTPSSVETMPNSAKHCSYTVWSPRGDGIPQEEISDQISKLAHSDSQPWYTKSAIVKLDVCPDGLPLS